MKNLISIDKNRNTVEPENMGVISDSAWEEFKRGGEMYEENRPYYNIEENIQISLERIFYLTGKGICVYVNGIPKMIKADSVSQDAKDEIAFVREDYFSVESYLLDDISTLIKNVERLEKANGNDKVQVVAVFDNKLAFKRHDSYEGVTSVFRGRLNSEVTDKERNVYLYMQRMKNETYILNDDGTTTLFAVDHWDEYHEEHENSIEGTPIAIIRDAIFAHEKENAQTMKDAKKDAGRKKEIWNVNDERMQKLQAKIKDYTKRNEEKKTELDEVMRKFHTTLALVEKMHGGKYETVLQIDGKAIALNINKNLVDLDVVNNIKQMSTIAAEKRGLVLMRKALRLYRRILNLKKSIARNRYLAAKHSREYAERRTGTRMAPRKVSRLAMLKDTMLNTRSKYQNFIKNKATATLERANYKVDVTKIYIGYLKQNGYEFLAFDNYKEYADYDRLYYAERGLTNWRQQRKYTRKPKNNEEVQQTQQIHHVDVQMPKRRRGRPKGSKNKPKNVAVTA